MRPVTVTKPSGCLDAQLMSLCTCLIRVAIDIAKPMQLPALNMHNKVLGSCITKIFYMNAVLPMHETTELRSYINAI